MSKDLRITKGGLLINNEWVYDEATEQGSYVDTDVTKNAIRLMTEHCTLDPDVTLKDIFLLLNTELDIFDALLGNWCKEIVNEGLNAPQTSYTGLYDANEMEYLELYWYVSKDADSLYGYNRPQFHGIGWELQEDQYHEWEPKEIMYRKGDRINWSLSFQSSNKLINYPVKLDSKFNIYQEDHTAKDFGEQVASFDNASYTLGHILDGIIWELSFHGGPQSRDTHKKELDEICDSIKSNELKDN